MIKGMNEFFLVLHISLTIHKPEKAASLPGNDLDACQNGPEDALSGIVAGGDLGFSETFLSLPGFKLCFLQPVFQR